MILVTGATGNAGGAVARSLVKSGEQVRAVVRDADRAQLPAGVEVAVGDLNDPQTLLPHLEKVTAAFLLSGYEGLEETLVNMRRAGVERVVLLSSSAAPNGDETNAVARYHILSERAVRQSGLGWTFLQPNTFMTNTFQWLPQLRQGDVIRVPFPDVRVATIDPDDIGAVAALALRSGAHEGRAYRLSGPESLSPADRVAILAEVLGRELHFEAQTNEDARAEMSAAMPAEYVDAFFRFFVDGDLDESAVLPTVQELTGRAPHSFEAWARAHADAFR
ncbi:MAG TPA: NAD(P)H-binding protein [Solirubrobacteraceae bacterium]|nr:NAD(P)H-binding protein [Solirubrobacteraceae bacterium]